MRKRPLMLIACVFLAGLVYQRYEAKAMLFLIGAWLLWEVVLAVKSKRFQKLAGRSVILLSAFILGMFHMQREENFRQAYMSKIEDGSWVTVWGELIKTETTDWGIRGILSDCYISLEGELVPCNDIMVYLSSNHFQMGQIHKVTGEIKQFSEARNQGNFDSKSYYQSLKIDFAIYEEECVVLSEDLGFWKKQLLLLREKIGAVYDDCMEKKAAGFYRGMVLGDKTNLDETLKELFALGGISHILAISGLHVSIIGRGVYKKLRKVGVGFWISGLLSGSLLLAYCVMVGNGMSTIRAVGMMLLFFLSHCMGRSYDMLNSLGAMVLLLLWENPFLIEYSGFWFSVMALIGIGFVGKEFVACLEQKESTKKKKEKKEKTRIASSKLSGLWMSLGITLTTLPVTAYSYFEIPMYSPLVNFIALPLLTPVFCCAVIGGLLGIWFPLVANVILMPCEWLLYFYEWICNTVSKLPGASIICGQPSEKGIVVYYLILFSGVMALKFCRQRQEVKSATSKSGPGNEDGQRKAITSRGERKLILGCTVFFCMLCIFYPKGSDFEITFLDVGQGDGIYISAGDGTTYFIDGGSTNVTSVGEYRILPFLKSKDISSIDYWFVSHCDTDHISGLLEVLDSGYKIEHLVVAENCPKDEAYTSLMEAVNTAGVSVIHMDVGHQIRSENMEITCLAPSSEQAEKEDRNENSLVLEVEWKTKKSTQSFKALFAGDITTEIEEMLCEDGLLEEVDLFKAIHHGSNYSNGEVLLSLIHPEYIVVSCSATNTYGHPGTQAVERMEDAGAEIFYTMESGQVTFPLIQ